MAFSFASVAAGLGDPNTNGAVQVHDGAELQEIQTDQLGFSSINREAKVRLLKKPWSSEDLSLSSASLLSIASSQGLLAAAGPDALVVCTTAQVRTAFQDKATNELKDVEPLLTIPHQKLSHVAFSADESVLVVTPSHQGGIIAYQVDQLKKRQATPALQLSTNQTPLRTLVPNPALASAQFFAAVTINGELMIADLANNALKQGSNGSILAQNVTCASWSNKGKQLVAGLGDGTALQLKPDGSTVATIPKSTSIPGDVHISSVTWLENDSFFIIYTPNKADAEVFIPPSEYSIVSREQSSYTFSKLPEVVPAFGVPRTPTHHFITRLRGWKPHLDDMLVLAATTSIDTGIISKTTKPLNNTDPVTNIFTCTTIDDDRRRANLPLSITDEPVDTSPIGVALDLSATEKVTRPIPSDEELLETDGPMPNLMILNNEGVLCSWWIIYNDSIYEKTPFSGFASLTTMNEARSAARPPPEAPPASTVSIGTVPQSPASAFAPPSTSFGATSSQPSFGSGTGFGSISKIGDTKSSWASTGFGTWATPSTNSPGFGQPAFGGPSVIASKPNALGAGGFATAGFDTSGFGKSGFGISGFGTGASTASPFSGTGTSSTKPTSSGFAAFSTGSGFSAATDANKSATEGSPFAKLSGSDTFGQGSNSSGFFKSTPFVAQKDESQKSVFGNSSPFQARSATSNDVASRKEANNDTKSSAFGFGSAFASTLADPQPVMSPTRDTEADMEDEQESDSGSVEEVVRSDSQFTAKPVEARSPFKPLVTPPSTISQPKTTPAPPISTLFGSGPPDTKTPQTLGSTAWSFVNQASTTPKDTPAPFKSMFGTKSISDSTPADVQKNQPVGVDKAAERSSKRSSEPGAPSAQNMFGIAKPVGSNGSGPFTNGTASRTGASQPDQESRVPSAQPATSRIPDDAPLPPDFLPANKTAAADKNQDDELSAMDSDHEAGEISDTYSTDPEDIADDVGPENERDDDEDADEEDDGEEEDVTEHVQTSPESSHKEDDTATSPTGGLFTKVSTSQLNKQGRLLFGEIGSSAPSFPPPKPQESPRSPSPVRNPPLETNSFRPEVRSFSAPAQPRSAIDQRKATYSQSAIAAQAAKAREEEAAREKTRLEAAREAQKLADAAQSQQLEDDENSRVQRELAELVAPSEKLDPFITYEVIQHTPSNKNDIPAQIERLYQDINSMIYTLGINARSLSSFLMYQKGQTPNTSWPSVLLTETPLDALNDEWFLEDIEKLHLGCTTIEQMLDSSSVQTVQKKLEQNYGQLIQDSSNLRHKISAYRRTTIARAESNGVTAPLSAEQSSVQQELRKASAAFHTNLVKIEGDIGVLRARLSELEPSRTTARSNGDLTSRSQKKPTFEAVAGTVNKMTSMVEKKSADLDVLELQLKRLGIAGDSPSTEQTSLDPSTPSRGSRINQAGTPGSVTSSVYHSAGSKFGGSVRGTPSRNGYGFKPNGEIVVAAADRERWQAKIQRRKTVASMLRGALEERHKSSLTS